MQRINNNRFNLKCKKNEKITVTILDGTVGIASYDLDGTSRTLRKGRELTFKVTGSRKLLINYPFKGKNGGSYLTRVSGSPDGQKSVDYYEQLDGEDFKARRYTFDI